MKHGKRLGVKFGSEAQADIFKIKDIHVILFLCIPVPKVCGLVLVRDPGVVDHCGKEQHRYAALNIFTQTSHFIKVQFFFSQIG